LSCMIVGVYGVSLCLLMPSVLIIDGFGELVSFIVKGMAIHWVTAPQLRYF